LSSVEDAKKRILSQVPLPHLIGESVELQQRSGRFVGCCPFHQEKTPSFTIFDDHYYCFGCKENGDAIDFIRKQNGLGFIPALKFLAEKYGVDAPELNQSDQEKVRRQKTSGLYQTMSLAQTHFVNNLKNQPDDSVKNYLLARGFSPENIEDFGFGYAKDSFQDLIDALKANRITTESMVACSLAGVSQKNERPYDFFRHRLMIPIRDQLGRTIAFGGRTLGDDAAKYINSRETILFDKSRVLFGLDRAKDAIRHAGHAIVTEGYMDTLQLWQNGLKNTVACLGTALTKQHLQLLSTFTRRVVLVFDGDSAGQNASLSSINAALDVPSIEVRVVSLPAQDDPDSYVRTNGSAALNALVKTSPHIVDFSIQQKLSDQNHLAIPELLRKEFLPWLMQVKDQMQRELILSRLSSATGISPQALRAEMRKDHPPAKDLAQPVTRVQRPPSSALSPKQTELFCHLFFANPSEEIGELATQILSIIEELSIAEVWLNFAQELVGALRADQAPCEMDKAQWQSLSDPVVSESLSRWETQKSAYAVKDRAAAMRTLLRTHRLAGKRNQVSQLKNQLNKMPASEHLALLTAISRINQEIMLLEKS